MTGYCQLVINEDLSPDHLVDMFRAIVQKKLGCTKKKTAVSSCTVDRETFQVLKVLHTRRRHLWI